MPQVDPRVAAYEYCKANASVDEAFSEFLTLQWFNAAWNLCADHVGLIYPPREIREEVYVHPHTGAIHLSHEPTGPVQFFAGGRLVATLGPHSPCFGAHRYHHRLCCPSLCCYCNLRAVYMIGQELGCELSPAFVQAVAQVFAYLAENRGDTQREPALLARCGALTFLSSGTTYVL